MTRRRSILGMAAAWVGMAVADSSSRAVEHRVVYIGSDTPSVDASYIAMDQSLERLATARGMSVQLEHRLMHALLPKSEQAAAVARMLDAGCDALIAPTGDAAIAAAHACREPGRTHVPPVLFASFLDPVRTGVVESMQRPGGRITGVSLADTWHAKRFELLHEAFAGIRRVGVLLDRLWTPGHDFTAEVAIPAAAFGIEAVRFDADTVDELDQVMRSAEAARMDAWYVTDTYVNWIAEATVIEHIHRLQRPSIHTTESEVADRGAVMAYAADRDFVFDALADLTLRTLRGEDPGSIPVQRPRRFVLAVRPRLEPAALRIHPAVVRRANRVY